MSNRQAAHWCVFACPLRFVHIDVINQLVQHLFGQRPHFHELAYRMEAYIQPITEDEINGILTRSLKEYTV